MRPRKVRRERHLSKMGQTPGTERVETPAIQRETVERLAHALARSTADFAVPPPANYIFWLGAGFSKTAGIPLAEGVVDRLLDKRWKPNARAESKLEPFSKLLVKDQPARQALIRKWATKEKLFGNKPITDWGATYGECLRLLPGEVDRQEFIIECIEEGRGRLNMAHLLLGQLIKNRFVETILTTNFDDLLLRALQLYFVVPSSVDPDSTSTLLTNSRFVQVAYLHGRLASYRQRHTPSEVQDSIQGFENYLAQALQDHGLVIIGYRGGEETPLHLLHKVLMERGTGPGRGLFGVTLSTDVRSLPAKVQTILSLKDCYWLPGWDADSFMTKLCAWPGIGLGIPDPSEWLKGMKEMLPPEARELLSRPDAANEAIELNKEDTPAESSVLSEADQTSTWLPQATKLSEDNPIDAIKLLSEARPESEDSLQGLWVWAKALSNAKRHAEAVEKGRRATQLFPQEPEAYRILGHALTDKGDYDDAITIYREAIALGGGDPLKQSIGVTLNAAKRLDEAAAVFAECANEAAEDYYRSRAFAWWGVTLHDLGKHDEAIDKFKQAVSINPNNNFAVFFWAEALRALGRNEEAIEKQTEYDAKTAPQAKSK